MTVIEKKKNIKRIIDTLSNENLEDIFNYLQQLSSKEKNRISIVKNLLKEEKWLFEELAK
jgi:ABC-type lipoprotein export system ATPase subunit